MRKKTAALAWLSILAAGAGALGQPVSPTPTPPPAPAADAPSAEAPARPAFRPIEGPAIINLPSVEVPSKGTLTTWFTHRFRSPVQGSDFHDLFSFDNGADIGIGVAYAPIPNLDFSVYRSSSLSLDPWEIAAKYRLFPECPFGVSIRAGGDIRSETGLTNRGTFFAQVILAFSIGDRIRLTAVPTYANKISGVPTVYFPPGSAPPPNDRSCVSTGFESFLCTGTYRNVFNVPAAISVALTHSINLHGEVTPRYGKADSIGVGWIVSIEKTLLRHRFAFTAGNQRQTTVDQYIVSPAYPTRFDPVDNSGRPLGAKGIYLGFNIFRQWKLN